MSQPSPLPSHPPRLAPRPRAVVAALLLAGAGCATVLAPAATPKVGSPPPPWVSWPAEQVASAKSAHAYQGQPLCQRCHTDPKGGLVADPIELCKSCHPQRHGNHPVGVVHKKPAKDLPYGPGGLLVCHTCHDPHDLTTRKKGLRLAFNELCLRCHEQH